MQKTRIPYLVVAPAAFVLASLSASADFSYPDFSSTAGLQLNGAAAVSGTALRLVPSVLNSGGSAFTSAQVPLGGLNSFSTYFQFQITNPIGITDADGAGADGLVFVVQTQNNNVGGAGGGIGYQGITPSVGIEFDTYNNGTFGANGGDRNNGNHVGIDTNGDLDSIVTANEGDLRFNDGTVWNAWVDYDGTLNNLEVRWSRTQTRPILPQLQSNVNLTSVLGQNTAFLGFTAATGSAAGNHDILQWQYVDEFAPILVPEPSSALFALGILGTIFQSRRRRA